MRGGGGGGGSGQSVLKTSWFGVSRAAPVLAFLDYLMCGLSGDHNKKITRFGTWRMCTANVADESNDEPGGFGGNGLKSRSSARTRFVFVKRCYTNMVNWRNSELL